MKSERSFSAIIRGSNFIVEADKNGNFSFFFSSQCELLYHKLLSRIHYQRSKVQNLGTFTPIWTLIRDLFEKFSGAHGGTLTCYQDLLNDVHLYQDIFQKKVKKHIQKDMDISRAGDLIAQLNHALAAVTKAKEQYHSVALDYERAKRLSSNATNSSPAAQETNLNNPLSSKQTERLERKYRQAQDEYKVALEKYNSVRNDYEKRFHEGLDQCQINQSRTCLSSLRFSLYKISRF